MTQLINDIGVNLYTNNGKILRTIHQFHAVIRDALDYEQ